MFISVKISFLHDPCPLPTAEKKRTLDDRERLLYAPFSGVGGIVYDKDAVYIELGGSHSHAPDLSNQRVPGADDDDGTYKTRGKYSANRYLKQSHKNPLIIQRYLFVFVLFF